MVTVIEIFSVIVDHYFDCPHSCTAVKACKHHSNDKSRNGNGINVRESDTFRITVSYYTYRVGSWIVILTP